MFKDKKFLIIKKAVSKEIAEYLSNYLRMKKQVYDTCRQDRYISPYETMLGFYENPKAQCPNTYSFYSDIAIETLMLKLQPIMEKHTKLKLQPAYTYGRIYKYGDILKRHKDRFSCEVSTTLNLGGDKWPIYLEPSGEKGKKGIKVDLDYGDMLVYQGCDLEHWREPFKGKECIQVFLHYNNTRTKFSKKNIFDTRPHLGLPSLFKKWY